MTVYSAPGSSASPVTVQSRYGNFIGGEWLPPSKGDYFENPSPVNGKSFTEVARSTGEDVELALDAAHAAKRAWGRTSAADSHHHVGDRTLGGSGDVPVPGVCGASRELRARRCEWKGA